MEHSEVNENNNVFINIIKHGRKDTTIKHEPFEMSRSHLKSLKQFNRNMPVVEQRNSFLEDEILKVQESSEQLMMLQPLLGLYIQNKYIDDFLRKTQNSYYNQLSKLIRTTESPPPVPPQEHPLDLSLKAERDHESQPEMTFDTVLKDAQELQFNFSNCTTPTELSNVYKKTLYLASRGNMRNDQLTESDTEISNVIQNIVKEEEQIFSCGICNQVFNIRDRLAKHIASCHKSKKKQSDITKTYECDVCKRSFARSDSKFFIHVFHASIINEIFFTVLTRHSRLHTGKDVC